MNNRKTEDDVKMGNKVRCDMLVVGGGLAGTMAGKRAAELGADVKILEQNPVIGVPVRCAEGISKRGIEKFFFLESECPECIASNIKGSYLVAPNEKRIFYGGEAYVLNKDVFNQFLAREAEKAGAQVLTRTKAKGYQRKKGGIEITAVRDGRKYSFFADIVIAADGPVSAIARWAGISKRLEPADTIIGSQVLMETGKSNDFAEFYLGKEIAPKGYAWVFPKGDKMLNVGIGITIAEQKKRQRNVDEYLNEFINKKFPNGKIVNKIHGIVPVGPYRRTHTANQVIVIGDAAGFTDSVTGGGNRFAMETGAIAGEVAVDAIINGDTSKIGLNAFENKILEISKTIKRSYKIRMVLEEFSDDDLNAVAETLTGEKFNNLSLPALILKMSSNLGNTVLAAKVMRAVL